jgi:hypothetical protein
MNTPFCRCFLTALVFESCEKHDHLQRQARGTASEHQLAEKNGAIFAAIKAIAAAHGPSISNQQVVMRWVTQV